MLIINNLATADDYTRELTLESEFGGRLVYLVANASVVARFRPIVELGGSQAAEYGPEQVLTPQSSFIDKISGAKFRSAIAGAPGRVVATLSEPGDILPASGTPFTGALAASGAVGAGVGILDKTIVPVQVVNDATERTLYSFTLPAGTLGTDGLVHLRIGGDFVANAAGGVLHRFYYGAGVGAGTLTIQFGAFTADRRNWFADAYLVGNGGAAVQQLLGQTNYMGSLNLGNQAGSLFNTAIAVDSATDQLLKYTVDYTAASVNLETRMLYAILEKLA